MKNLTKLVIVVLAFSFTTKSFAQTFGIRGGLNLSTILDKDDQETYSSDYNMKPGFHIGGTVEFPFNEMFVFETGLFLSTKGYKYNDSGTEFGYDWEDNETVNLYYLDIPLTAKASFDVGSLEIYGALGPYLGLGLSGKGEYDYSYAGNSDSGSETINWGSGNDDHLKRLDFGLTFGAGVEIKSFLVGVSYSLGLANISADTEGGYKISNRVLAISAGYKFGGK